MASVSIWVLIAFLGAHSLQLLISEHWAISLLIFITLLTAMKSILPKLLDRWHRKALLHSWRRWLTFEFWPAWLFYLPIVPHYIYLSLKTGGFFHPFYANPGILNAGLIGESKWDFLRHLDPDGPSTLNTIKVPKTPTFAQAKGFLRERRIEYPFIVKPDVGQRGFGVRLIHGEMDLSAYLRMADFDLIFQQKSGYEKEAGIFYIRYPGEEKGMIFSITDKIFPSLIGDGDSAVGELIMADPRARIIAPVYFDRHKNTLNSVLLPGEIFRLSECGNHCQGAIFLDGIDLKSEALEAEIDRVSKTIPHFYFGRFDVRYESREALLRGECFEIVEVNGAGAEATHIWDAKTKLIAAYGVLFKQWAHLFSIGKKARERHPELSNVNLARLLKEALKVVSRRESLSVSS